MPGADRPFVIVEGPPTPAHRRLAKAVRQARTEGWVIVDGWAAPLARERIVCTGHIDDADDARRALLAAVLGAGLIVAIAADRDTIDRFIDDLGGLGPVEHVIARPV